MDKEFIKKNYGAMILVFGIIFDIITTITGHILSEQLQITELNSVGFWGVYIANFIILILIGWVMYYTTKHNNEKTRISSSIVFQGMFLLVGLFRIYTGIFNIILIIGMVIIK